jgi:choline dehydrogenase-like flavoprotein
MTSFRSSYDAIVLGSGMGGAVSAYQMTRRGLRVLLVEQGGSLSPHAGGPADDGSSSYILDLVGERSVPISCIGGQTKFYGAALYRFRLSDFEARELESGLSPQWPVSYADLAPYYDHAERVFKVHGDDAGDATAPPRDTPYPYPPVPFDPRVSDFAGRLQRAGGAIAALPRGVDFGPGGACTNCAECDAFLCRRDAKMDAEVAAVRPALSTGLLDIADQTFCAHINLDPAGERVVGVRLLRDGAEFSVGAGVVVAASGQRGTVELFLRSRNSRFPNGLGNHSGQLGQNLAGHSTGMIFPLISLKKLPPTQTKSFALNQWHDGGPGWSFPLGVVQLAGQMPFWREASRWVRPVARLVGDHCFTMFYMTEAPPTAGAGFQIVGDEVAGLTEPQHCLESFRHLRRLSVQLLLRAGYPALARQRAPYLWHMVGTTRMGDDPEVSVTDAFGRVHDLQGLYVADAGILPSAGCVNTGLTIAALAMRTADHIAGVSQEASSQRT